MSDDLNDFQPKSIDGPAVRPQISRLPVEIPILDSQLRSQLAPGGLKGFYASNKFYFWAIIAGVVIIAVLSFFAFRKAPTTAPKEANVAISVQVPDKVPSGGESVYTINLQNNDSQKLVNLQLEATYPDGFTYVDVAPNSFKPQNLSGTIFPVQDLLAGQGTTMFLKLKGNGNVGDQKTLDLKLHYSYSNFNSQFTKDQQVTFTLTASDVAINLDGPQTTSNSQLDIYTVTYQNNSGADIQNARIKMDYPPGFNFAAAQPQPSLGSDTWDIGTLAKGGSGQIQIQGNFSSANPGESKTLTAEFLILGQDGNYFTQNSANITTAISSLPLMATQAIQSGNSNEVVNPGDDVTVTINYQNNASTVATGVNIEVDLNTKVVDPASVRAQGAQLNNYSIIWNASGVPQLANLLPNQSGQVSFSFKVNNPATKDSSTNLDVVSKSTIKANEYSAPFPGNTLDLKVSSPAGINTGLNYISGSLPPQVGKGTVYQVALSLTNSSNNFTNGQLTAFLPGLTFDQSSLNSAETPNVQFDPSTSKLTWNFGSLLANTGRFAKARTLSFNITLNPSAASAGSAVTLMKDIQFTATDSYTNQPVTVTAQNISTNDLQGQNGYQDGIVER